MPRRKDLGETCDVCRRRKIKCVPQSSPPPPSSLPLTSERNGASASPPFASARAPCRGCASLGLGAEMCRFEYPGKKMGRPKKELGGDHHEGARPSQEDAQRQRRRREKSDNSTSQREKAEERRGVSVDDQGLDARPEQAATRKHSLSSSSAKQAAGASHHLSVRAASNSQGGGGGGDPSRPSVDDEPIDLPRKRARLDGPTSRGAGRREDDAASSPSRGLPLHHHHHQASPRRPGAPRWHAAESAAGGTGGGGGDDGDWSLGWTPDRLAFDSDADGEEDRDEAAWAASAAARPTTTTGRQDWAAASSPHHRGSSSAGRVAFGLSGVHVGADAVPNRPPPSDYRPAPSRPEPLGSHDDSRFRPPPPPLDFDNDDDSSRTKRVPQVEDVLPYADLSFFISLYLRSQHALVPLVHRPSFSARVARREDRGTSVRSRRFRALLFNLVVYVICQVPKRRMAPQFSAPQLEAIQLRCHEASRRIRRSDREPPDLLLLTAVFIEYYFYAASGRTNEAILALNESIQLGYILGLHGRDDPETGGDNIDRELKRRMFWQLYVTDKTEASAGMPMQMNDFEGTCPYPLEVDDEYITAAGSLPQPPDQPSYMVGFMSILKLYRIMSECLFRHRTLQRNAVPETDRQGVLLWCEEMQRFITRMLDDLPAVLKPHESQQHEAEVARWDEEAMALYGMQSANVLVTSVAVRFALSDLKAILLDTDAREEREKASASVYALLSSIPIDDLASNGESMRGKVIRIICALLSTDEVVTDEWSQGVKDWWEMYSKIQFVQVIPSLNQRDHNGALGAADAQQQQRKAEDFRP